MYRGVELNKIGKVLISLFVFVVVFLQCGCSAINFKQEYDKGVKAYNDKNYNLAIEHLNNALEYKHDSYSAMCLLGASYAYKKDYNLAEKTFQDAIKLYPNEWNAYVFLGDIKKRQKDYQGAIDYYETSVSLASMGGKEKLYYKNYIKKLKEERATYLNKDPIVQQQSKEKFKSEIINAYAKDKTVKEEILQTGEVVLTLDNKIWEKFSEQKDAKSSIVQYRIKGEDVKAFNWTKLITVQYFELTNNFKMTLNEYFNFHVGAISTTAKNNNKPFEKKIIQQSKNNILYEWNFGDGTETEISRIFYTPKGIYHLHVSKKGVFTPEEKLIFINILNEALLR